MDEKKRAEMVRENEALVEYTAPIDPTGRRQDITVAVNGETIKLQRGVKVKIKRKFLKVLENAARQSVAACRYQDKAQEAGKRALAEL